MAKPEGGQQSQQSRVESPNLVSRESMVKSLINGIFPDMNIQQYVEINAIKYNKPVAELNEDQLGEASLHQRLDGMRKAALIDALIQSQIPDEQLLEYVSALHTFAVSLCGPGEQLSFNDIQRWLGALETVDRVLLYQELVDQWKVRFLSVSDAKLVRKRTQDLSSVLIDISGIATSWPKPIPKEAELTKTLFLAFSDLYELSYQLETQRPETAIDRRFVLTAKQLGLRLNSAEQTKLMLHMYREVLARNFDLTDEIILKWVDAISQYALRHGLSSEKITGLIDQLLPAMQRDDPQVAVLLLGSNKWGMHIGDFGVGDFICHAYANPVTAANLNELLLAARAVPATSLHRLEQNRTDAKHLSGIFGILKDFIHDQRPYIHEVLTSMVQYYDTGDRLQLEQILGRTDYLRSMRNGSSFFDRSLYEREVGETSKSGGKTKAIEILRRLVVNTQPVEEVAPTTSDELLNQCLQNIEHGLLSGSSSIRELLTTALEYVTTMLIQKMEEKAIGIEPNVIIALSWIERRTFDYLAQMSYEDQVGAIKQQWFTSVLRFQELIGSP